jgi:hypothetical protein
VGHDVVRMETHEYVRKNRYINHRPQRLSGQAPQRLLATDPVQRHRRRTGTQRHPAADPRPGDRVVLAAVRRAHPAQFRVDGGAVVALVVVLGEDLPVRSGVVAAGRGDDQPRRLMGCDDLVQGGQRPRAGRAAGTVDEHQAVPFGRGQRRERPACGVEVTEPGRAAQLPGQRVRPGVVRADDRPRARGRAAGQQLVPAVPAGVRERVHHAVRVAGQQHAAGAGLDGQLGAGRRQLRTQRRAGPAAAEEVPPLPFEHRGVGVRGGWQHAAFPERPQRLRQRAGIDRGGRIRGLGRGLVRRCLRREGVVTDHKSRLGPPEDVG